MESARSSARTSAPAPGEVSAPPAANPVLVEVWRGSWVESQHRGAFAVVDGEGQVLEGRGDFARPHFARSTIKSLQALPLLESGAAAHFGLGPRELCLALASHNAEPCHTDTVAALLARLGLGPDHLQCGPQPPGDPEVRRELEARGERPTALHNNCSGKHAGFLALCRHLGREPAEYLEPAAPTQLAVRRAVGELCGADGAALTFGLDGCSAPTFRLTLRELATGFARLANPQRLGAARAAACTTLTTAVAAHPELIAGRHRRLCTDLVRVTEGRLFPKIGAEGLYCVGWVGGGRGLALKLDDGQARGLHPLVVQLLHRLRWIDDGEFAALRAYAPERELNWAGREVGRLEVSA
jgi:L-asparaginase II